VERGPERAGAVRDRVGYGHSSAFDLNAFQYPTFSEDDIGVIRFRDCSRYRLGNTNDEGWYRGQCRYSKAAPAWGAFYELSGPDEAANLPDDWVNVGSEQTARHFLFYFRDDTFECFATDWLLEPIGSNALFRASGSGS
jgi:hypothetical protein